MAAAVLGSALFASRPRRGVTGGAGDAGALSALTVAITVQSNAYRREASSRSSSPRASTSCRSSIPLRTTTELILEFALRAPFEPHGPLVGLTPPAGSVPASIFDWRRFRKTLPRKQWHRNYRWVGLSKPNARRFASRTKP